MAELLQRICDHIFSQSVNALRKTDSVKSTYWQTHVKSTPSNKH